MYKIKIFFSIIIFTTLLVVTSFIKNQTRVIEKKIYNLGKIIYVKEKDYKESQLDFFYLTSPLIVEQKIKHLDNTQYVPMDNSKIFLDLEAFIGLKKKYVNYEK